MTAGTQSGNSQLGLTLPSMNEMIPVFGIQWYSAQAKHAFLFV